MVKVSGGAAVGGLALDRAGPLSDQIFADLRDRILDGRLAGGARLPSSRVLAAELGVSRAVVVTAYERLAAEGYVEGRVGAGTRVAATVPDLSLTAADGPARDDLSQRGRRLTGAGAGVSPPGDTTHRWRCFAPGAPALDAFPFAAWRRLSNRLWRSPRADWMGYGDPAGYAPLRAAIADYLVSARGLRCSAEQVIVVSGSQQAIDLLARLLLDPGDAVLIENPAYQGASGALARAGARLVPVPVDDDGMAVDRGLAGRPDARLAFVTPSRQFPLGVTLSLARRLALLDWARNTGAWIIEDDYDSEYRYRGRPLTALQGLDEGERVIYLGSFSKVLFPALRLGYLVVPPALVGPAREARRLTDGFAPTFTQAVLARFMAEGRFTAHIRRTRTLYAARQRVLVEALDGWGVAPADSGMHLVVDLPPGLDDRAVSARAEAVGVTAPPLSVHYLQGPARHGLLLGYTGFEEGVIRDAARRLAGVV